MATHPGPLYDWPWARLGNFKYALYIPIIVKATQANVFGGYDKDNFCLHMIVATALRYLQGQIWMTLSRTHHIIEKYQIQQKPINFQQVDRESNWEDYILLHTILIIIIHAYVPGSLPLWDWKSILIMFLLHVGPTEFAYYWLHRALHHHYLFTRYHSHHHASFVTEAVSGRTDKVDFIFLVHGTEILSALHQPAGIASFASHPFQSHWYILPLWPLAAIAMVLFWIFGKAYALDKYKLDNLSLQTWVMPRFAFQFFLKFERPSLNKLIEEAILRAEAKGCQVFTLGALNKMEALNGGGELFVKKNPNLRMRVVHGNTLTVAAILDKLPEETSSIFLTGSTSKVGRAIALYLCRQRVRVLMLTTSRERFERILHEAPVEFQEFLVQVTKYQAGKDCKTWVMGKWALAEDQKWAPTGTHFHQFVLPPIQELRKDCTYGGLVGMRLPQAVKGYRTCELAMPRGCVHACHAGGLVHALEGWKHNEVGAIDTDQIDVTWKAAVKHGFLPL